MPKIEDIEIHTGKPDFGFKPIRKLEAKCEASNALMPAPTVDEVNGRLRALAAKVGANAVIDVEYNSGISFTSWKSMKATGLAVLREADEVACPTCAELVKRAAKRCRFCGEELAVQPVAISTSGHPALPGADSAAPAALPYEEPLRDNNNPAIIVGLIVLALVILSAVVAAAGA